MWALFDRAEAKFGPIDVFVNNAGIIKVSPLAEVSDEDYQRLIRVKRPAISAIVTTHPTVATMPGSNRSSLAGVHFSVAQFALTNARKNSKTPDQGQQLNGSVASVNDARDSCDG
jgi:NAD(P)-dependent dehydrogenase (short-subunit alcohol dehydrogenase family)